MEPHLEIIKNPLDQGRGSQFTHFEISTVRDWYPAWSDEMFTERAITEEDCDPDNEEAAGDVYYSLYGRLSEGGAEHIADRVALGDIYELLERIGGYVRRGIRRRK